VAIGFLIADIFKMASYDKMSSALENEECINRSITEHTSEDRLDIPNTTTKKRLKKFIDEKLFDKFERFKQ